MTELSHWDFADQFSAHEAAALIAGIDPAQIGYHRPILEPVLKRMEADYENARSSLYLLIAEVPLDKSIAYPLPGVLSPTEFKFKYTVYLSNKRRGKEGHADLEDWMEAAKGRFSEMTYWRTDIAEWLASNGFLSKYAFNRASAKKSAASDEQAVNVNPGPWPWGAHETTLLRELAATANQFWALYDPSDQSTAVTNDVVVQWLRDRGNSKNMAEAMATILRADGLKTGPR